MQVASALEKGSDQIIFRATLAALYERSNLMIRTIVTIAVLTLSATFSAQAGCRNHSDQAMSCVEGSVWDDQAKTCVPQISS